MHQVNSSLLLILALAMAASVQAHPRDENRSDIYGSPSSLYRSPEVMNGPQYLLRKRSAYEIAAPGANEAPLSDTKIVPYPSSPAGSSQPRLGSNGSCDESDKPSSIAPIKSKKVGHAPETEDTCYGPDCDKGQGKAHRSPKTPPSYPALESEDMSYEIIDHHDTYSKDVAPESENGHSKPKEQRAKEYPAGYGGGGSHPGIEIPEAKSHDIAPKKPHKDYRKKSMGNGPVEDSYPEGTKELEQPQHSAPSKSKRHGTSGPVPSYGEEDISCEEDALSPENERPEGSPAHIPRGKNHGKDRKYKGVKEEDTLYENVGPTDFSPRESKGHPKKAEGPSYGSAPLKETYTNALPDTQATGGASPHATEGSYGPIPNESLESFHSPKPHHGKNGPENHGPTHKGYTENISPASPPSRPHKGRKHVEEDYIPSSKDTYEIPNENATAPHHSSKPHHGKGNGSSPKTNNPGISSCEAYNDCDKAPGHEDRHLSPVKTEKSLPDKDHGEKSHPTPTLEGPYIDVPEAAYPQEEFKPRKGKHGNSTPVDVMPTREAPKGSSRPSHGSSHGLSQGYPVMNGDDDDQEKHTQLKFHNSKKPSHKTKLPEMDNSSGDYPESTLPAILSVPHGVSHGKKPHREAKGENLDCEMGEDCYDVPTPEGTYGSGPSKSKGQRKPHHQGNKAAPEHNYISEEQRKEKEHAYAPDSGYKPTKEEKRQKERPSNHYEHSSPREVPSVVKNSGKYPEESNSYVPDSMKDTPYDNVPESRGPSTSTKPHHMKALPEEEHQKDINYASTPSMPHGGSKPTKDASHPSMGANPAKETSRPSKPILPEDYRIPSDFNPETGKPTMGEASDDCEEESYPSPSDQGAAPVKEMSPSARVPKSYGSPRKAPSNEGTYNESELTPEELEEELGELTPAKVITPPKTPKASKAPKAYGEEASVEKAPKAPKYGDQEEDKHHDRVPPCADEDNKTPCDEEEKDTEEKMDNQGYESCDEEGPEQAQKKDDVKGDKVTSVPKALHDYPGKVAHDKDVLGGNEGEDVDADKDSLTASEEEYDEDECEEDEGELGTMEKPKNVKDSNVTDYDDMKVAGIDEEQDDEQYEEIPLEEFYGEDTAKADDAKDAKMDDEECEEDQDVAQTADLLGDNEALGDEEAPCDAKEAADATAPEAEDKSDMPVTDTTTPTEGDVPKASPASEEGY